MNPLFMLLVMAILGSVTAIIANVVKEKRGKSQRYQKILEDFYTNANSMLEPGEEIEAYCGYFPCAAVTGKRLLIGGKKGIQSILFSDIKKIQGMNFSGSKTNDPRQMSVLEIKANKKFALGNHSAGFEEVVESLQKHIKKQ